MSDRVSDEALAAYAADSTYYIHAVLARELVESRSKLPAWEALGESPEAVRAELERDGAELERLRAEVERLTDERERGTAALRTAFGPELWQLGHPAYVVVHLREEIEKVTRLWKASTVESDALRAAGEVL